MNVYADTSTLFALFHPGDTFWAVVNRHQHRLAVDFFYPPWLRFELRHNLTLVRVDPDGETAWQALQAGERGRLRGVNQDWLGVIQSAGELSGRLSMKHPGAGASDVLHVAAALDIQAAEFWTCDHGQADFARAAGLKVHQFR